MKKMYMIQGLNSLYFVWSEMSENDIRTKTKTNETITECCIEYPFSIRYGGQPLYEWTLKTDKRNGLPYIAEWIIDKKQFIIDNNVNAERKYFL